jgi:hypothetical protein
MPSLSQVVYDFPAANVPLSMPSLSLFASAPEYTPLDPYPLSSSEVDDEPTQRVLKYVVGMYDVPLQLDLWCRDKVERSNLLEEFMDAINPIIIPGGVSLQLTGYHGVWCRYDLTGFQQDDGEASSQRGEWRVRINVLANTRAVKSRTEFVMKEFETNLETPDTIENE